MLCHRITNENCKTKTQALQNLREISKRYYDGKETPEVLRMYEDTALSFGVSCEETYFLILSAKEEINS